MRALLVDWMVEVQESFELNHETLYLAVKLVDLFLTRSTKTQAERDQLTKEELQLLGASALFIASKFDVSCLCKLFSMNVDKCLYTLGISSWIVRLQTFNSHILSYKYLFRAKIAPATHGTAQTLRHFRINSILCID